MTITRHEFQDAGSLAQALAEDVAKRLDAAVASRGTASLCVSGGSTPKRFFEALSRQEIDWKQVGVTLVDERFVPADHSRSNHLLVASHLLKDKAAAASFLPLYGEAESLGAAAAAATRRLEPLGAPFDVVILGMGSDGHTASFFPGGDNLALALDAEEPRGVLSMKADGAGEDRLTLSFSSLADAGFLVLHIEGEEKRAVLEKALAGKDETEMPIRAFLNRARSPLDIFWAP